ncbi:MAG: DUF721 domain-containing protein [Deltaproteobacteria bacterium]|nr:DUF721 domain-containing protein [Deltaproteobacteria bacterium]MBI4373967.1 DUF721 domain-containing protein [Deltaproteobacteria bacterium]
MRKKLNKFIALKSVLPSAMRHWKVDSKMTAWSLQEKWPSLVGEMLSRKTRPLRVQSAMLWVGVSGAAWANELQLLQCEILTRIQSEFPAIKEIRFQVEAVSSGRSQ